jgi:hypothetical protein
MHATASTDFDTLDGPVGVSTDKVLIGFIV